MRRVVVVGGSLAGVHAAEALRERDYAGDLVLVSAESTAPYDRPPLSKEALQGGVDAGRLALRSPEWFEEQGIRLQLETRATALDPSAQEVHLSDGTTLPYDGAIIATGSTARRLGGLEGVRVHVVRTLQDAVELRGELLPGRHLLLVGAGFIGLEIAATARALGLEVTVVEVARTPLARALGEDVGAWFRDLHERNGVQMICDTHVRSVEPWGNGAQVVLDDGRELVADVVVAGVGAGPATEWLTSSGLELAGGVHCSADLSTPAPSVVAAGDIARWYNPIFDEEMRVEHWTNAIEQGRHAAGTLLGERHAFSAVPYFWTDQYDARARFVGRADAASQVLLLQVEDSRLVALYGRDGMVRGALCVNAPRQLATYRAAIADQVPWGDLIAEVDTDPITPTDRNRGHNPRRNV